MKKLGKTAIAGAQIEALSSKQLEMTMTETSRVVEAVRWFANGLCALVVGFICVTGVHAASSKVTPDPKTVDQNSPNPAEHKWAGALGSIETTSGPVWVTGKGSLSEVTKDNNGWATAWYGQNIKCEITCEPPKAKWVIDADCEMFLKAKGEGVDSGRGDRYRAETTGAAEMKGDFAGFEENQVSVDTYTGKRSWVLYDAEGGGENPTKYKDGGILWNNEGPDTNTYPFSLDVSGEVFQKTIKIWMYVRGKQYMHAPYVPPLILQGSLVDKGSGDTELETKISGKTQADGTTQNGWDGTLTSFYWDDGARQWVQINVHMLPSGAKVP